MWLELLPYGYVNMQHVVQIIPVPIPNGYGLQALTVVNEYRYLKLQDGPYKSEEEANSKIEDMFRMMDGAEELPAP